MDSKKKFRNTQDMLNFLRETRKQNDAFRRKLDKEFEKEQKAWQLKDRVFDLDEEKREYEGYLKNIKRVIGEHKILVEKIERIMRKAEKHNPSKDKRYKIVAVEGKPLLSEPIITYKNKKK